MIGIDFISIGIISIILIILLIRFIRIKLKGEIEIQIDKYQFSAGEKIAGKVILNLKKPLKTEELKVNLIAERFSKTKNSLNRYETDNTEQIFEVEKVIFGQNNLSSGKISFDFELNVPQNINEIINSRMEKIINGLQKLIARSNIIRWYLTAELEIEGLNLTNRVQISIL